MTKYLIQIIKVVMRATKELSTTDPNGDPSSDTADTLQGLSQPLKMHNLHYIKVGVYLPHPLPQP